MKIETILRNFKLKEVLLAACSLIVCALILGCSVEETTVTGVPPKPAINYFTADIASIKSGDPVNLNWDVINADSVRIEPGIGIVAPAGTYKVNPANNMEYVLTATNTSGEATSRASVQVTQAPQSPECMSVPCDPVTGRNADISFRWEQLSLCTEYQLQIFKDPQFTMLIYDRQQFTPYSVTSPGLVYLAGGILECGHTYYIRIRCTAAATGQRVRSPWSILGCLTVNSGLPIGGANK